MGEDINTERDATYGSITLDGKYFFFNRIFLGENLEESKANIFWVGAKVNETLRHK